MVMKNSNTIQDAIHKREPGRRLHRFDVVYKIDSTVHTVVETVKEFGTHPETALKINTLFCLY
jgi:hypothetical protein